MPGIENSDTGSGRVTRSLRKRLTSVDTDSSRPGTPVLTSLQSLQEAVTPSKRTTRRTSLSTPVPTPSKGKSRLDGTEAVNSPARRSTRRRSSSTHDQEETTVPLKSKEPAFDVVEEEETVEKSPENKSKTGSRSSPRLVSRPRSQTPNTENSQKTPEVSPQVLKHMKHSKVMLKKEHIENNTVSSAGAKGKEAQEASPQKSWAIKTAVSPNETANRQVSSEKLETPEKSTKHVDAKDDVSTPSKKSVEKSPKGITSPENESTLSVTEILEQKPKKSVGRPPKVKTVEFNNTAVEEGEKSVFPKTPGLTKSKSYILDSSKPDGDQSINKSECKLDDTHEETDNDAVKDPVEDDNEIVSTKTPYKLKLNSVESSTPIHNTSSVNKKDKNEITQKDALSKDAAGSVEDFMFPKSWSHSVSGTVTDLVKIDSIESEESKKKKLEEQKTIKKNANIAKSAKLKRLLHDEDSDEEVIEEDDLLTDDDEEEDEEMEREKSMFVDDEAMEVAEGEESMDSEERAYLEENEIPVYAESIGSEDTVQEECEEEADEEDAAFVVSDTEEILHEESDSDDMNKKSAKQYKRIIRNIDSSDEESVSGKDKDDDFCLLIDSSMEGNMSVKEKLDKIAKAETLSESLKSIKKKYGASGQEKSSKNIGNQGDKQEEIDVASDEENEKQLEEPRIEKDNEASEVVDLEESDVVMSKKERKSLKNRKSVEAKVQSTPSPQDDNAKMNVDEDVTENVSSEALKTNENIEQSVEGNESEQKDTLSKKERKSLLSLTNRKSLMTPEKNCSDLSEDKLMNSPLRRKSLKKPEVESVDVDSRSEMETEHQDNEIEASTSRLSKEERRSLNKSEFGELKNSPLMKRSFDKQEKEKEKGVSESQMETEDEDIKYVKATPSKLSKKERKSLKCQPDENKSPTCTPFKRKSLKTPEEEPVEVANINEMETEEACSPFEKKSLQTPKEKLVEDASSNEMEIQDRDTETNTDQEAQTSKLLQEERKSLKFQADENNRPACSPFKRKSLQKPIEEAVEDASSTERHTEDKDPGSNTDLEASISKLSKLSSRKSLKSQADENKSPTCSPFKRKSLKNPDEEPVEVANINEMETEDNITENNADDEMSTSMMSKKDRKSLEDQAACSPRKRKSLLKPEVKLVADDSSNEIDTEDKDTETNTDTEVPTSKKDRKSLNKSELVEIKNSPLMKKSFQVNDSIDNEMAATQTKPLRKSVKSQADENKNTSTRSPIHRRSFNKQAEGLKEEDQETETSTPIETSTSKLSKKDRVSLNKSLAPDENQNSFIISPFKKKSVSPKGENQEANVKEGALETPKKSSFQERLSTPNKADVLNSGKKLSKKERKSLLAQELIDQDSADVEMIDDGEPTENEKAVKTPKKESLKITRISLSKSTSENNAEEDTDDDIGSKSLIAEYDEEAKLSPNTTLREIEPKPNKVGDAKAQKKSPLGSNNDCNSKSPKGKNKSPFRHLRSPWNKSRATVGDLDDDSEQSDDSSNPNKDKGEGGEDKLIDVLKNSVNTMKKKSLSGSSTDDTEQHNLEGSVNKSKFDRSVLSVEGDASDEAETTSAFESSLVSEDKSRSFSKISRKSLNRSILSPKTSDKSDSQRKANKSGTIPQADFDSENEEGNAEDQAGDVERNEENDLSKVMDFLGEEETEHNSSPDLNSTRRKSLNKSKLDETFHLESNNNSMLSILHRSLLKKSLKHGKTVSESVKKSKEEFDDGEDSGDVTDAEFSAEEEVEILKKVLPDKGLSVSLSGIEKKKKSKNAGEQIHKSFTIGVSLHNTTQKSPQKSISNSSSYSVESSGNDSLSEREDLEKIEDVQVAGPYKSRNSFSKVGLNGEIGSPLKTKTKRYSMYVSGEGASQSFVENLAKEKKKLQSKHSRKSNSFCGVSTPCEEPEKAQPEQPKSHKSPTQSSDTIKSDTKTDIQRILSRCDEILEAANQAKREAKLNAKKTKVKKPKWMDKEEKVKEEEEVKIPLVSRKEIKRKEKMKKELAKAIKHSTAMLKTIDPKLVKKLKASEVERTSSKRLPADFLDELEEPKPKKNKTKEIESTPPSDKENSKKTSNKTQHRPEVTLHNEKKKKKHSKEIIETAAGTVIVEPATPSKLKFQNGFRESPKTPVGFKIQDLDSNREKKKGVKKLFAASGMPEQQDVSNLRTTNKSKKRKFQIEEPVYTLPKTQWTSSGVFIEEDVRTVHHPLANSTATQFMVSSLSGSKKAKSKPVSSATLSTALNFKKNALFSDKVKREPARNLLYRKERGLVNNRF